MAGNSLTDPKTKKKGKKTAENYVITFFLPKFANPKLNYVKWCLCTYIRIYN